VDFGISGLPVLLETEEGRHRRKQQADDRARSKVVAAEKKAKGSKGEDPQTRSRTRTASSKVVMATALETGGSSNGSAPSHYETPEPPVFHNALSIRGFPDLGRVEKAYFPDVERFHRALAQPNPTLAFLKLALADAHAQVDHENSSVCRISVLGAERTPVWNEVVKALKDKHDALYADLRASREVAMEGEEDVERTEMVKEYLARRADVPAEDVDEDEDVEAVDAEGSEGEEEVAKGPGKSRSTSRVE
jgi:hypothetical protein